MREQYYYWMWVVHTLIDKNYDGWTMGRRHYMTRWDRIKVTDGPIHTLWCKSTIIRYNWLTIGFTCWRKGHLWREQTAGIANKYKFVPTGEPGVVRREWETTKEFIIIHSCARCGNYRGSSKRDLTPPK